MNKRTESNRIVRENIGKALFCLMQDKQFSDITVTDIITKASVARASYYRNFDSKEDIIRGYVFDMLKNYEEETPRKNGDRLTYDNLCHFFGFIFEYKSILKTIYSSGLSGLFLESLNNYFEKGWNKTRSTADKLVLYAHAGALFNVIIKWIESGAKETPEEIARSFYTILSHYFYT